MDNGQLHDDTLFRAVQQRLSDYETPYEGADWDAMRRSLDQLPQTTRNRFQFRFSMNALLIGAGVLVVALLGSYLLWRPSTTSTDQTKNPVINPAPAARQIQPGKPPVEQQLTTIPAQHQDSVIATAQQAPTTLTQSATQKPKTTKPIIDQGDLRFGDQIDPRKGFILPTHEADSLRGVHLSKPDKYYDVEDNGKIKPIQIGNGSDSTKLSPVDSTKRD